MAPRRGRYHIKDDLTSLYKLLSRRQTKADNSIILYVLGVYVYNRTYFQLSELGDIMHANIYNAILNWNPSERFVLCNGMRMT